MLSDLPSTGIAESVRALYVTIHPIGTDPKGAEGAKDAESRGNSANHCVQTYFLLVLEPTLIILCDSFLWIAHEVCSTGLRSSFNMVDGSATAVVLQFMILRHNIR